MRVRSHLIRDVSVLPGNFNLDVQQVLEWEAFEVYIMYSTYEAGFLSSGQGYALSQRALNLPGRVFQSCHILPLVSLFSILAWSILA